jgi:HEAT repeat protein
MNTPDNASPPPHPGPVTETQAALRQAGPLAAFTLNLAKAMLRTGYYAPDHPQAQQSRVGLYDEFRRLLEDRPGLTYLVGLDRERRTLMIDGYDMGPLPLDKVMIGGMAELFTPKLLEFFDRRHLLSFSLLAGIEAEEFNTFIIMMSEPPRPGPAEEERDRLTQAFLDQHVVHVSTLFEADVLGRERRLPWRVERALSRLGRDLKLLPLYKQASQETIQRIKLQIIDEVIRPLRTAELLADLLLNCDILAKDIAVLQEAQVEHQIVARIPAELLVATARRLTEGLQQLAAKQDDESLMLESRHRLIIRNILEHLDRSGADVSGELVEALVAQAGFPREQLPERLQHVLRRQLIIQEFLTERDAYLRGLSHFPAGKFGERLDAVARLVFPELLRRGDHWTEAAAMLHALNVGEHQSGAADTVQGLLDTFHGLLATQATVERLLDALSDENLDKEPRDAVAALLSLSGAAAGEGLRKVYAATTSVSIRTSAFEVMKRIGAPALVPFLAALPDIEHEWPAIHHILAALDDRPDPALAQAVTPFLRHENAHVRQAALNRVFQLLGPASEPSLIEALADPDAATRHAAVAYLGQLHSRNPKALAFYAAALQPDEAAEPEDDDVSVEICRSLSGLGEARFADGSSTEQLLLNALRQEARKKRISGMFRKGLHQHSERVRVALCQALGATGTPATGDVLRELASSEADPVAAAARAAADQIGERGRGAGRIRTAE